MRTMRISVATFTGTLGIAAALFVSLAHAQSEDLGFDQALGGPAFIAIVDHAVVKIDATGNRKVLFAMPTKDLITVDGSVNGQLREHDYGELRVDAASGRWVLPRQSDRALPGTLIFGDRNGVVAEVPGDPACVSNKRGSCIIAAKMFASSGKYVFIESLRNRGTTLARYTFGQSDRVEIAGPEIATTLTLDEAHQRALYVSRKGIHVTSWQPSSARIAAAPVRIAVNAEDQPPTVVGDDIVYVAKRETPDRRLLETTIERATLPTGKRTVVKRATNLTLPFALQGFRSSTQGVYFADHAAKDGKAYEGCKRKCVTYLLEGSASRVVAEAVDLLVDVSSDGRFGIFQDSQGGKLYMVELSVEQGTRRAIEGATAAYFVRE